MTTWSRIGLTICLVLAGLGATAPAIAQPARRAAARQPAPPPPAPPPAEPDPETRAKLDEQAAALGEASKKLVEQQQQLEKMSAALAESQRDQAALRESQEALRREVAAEQAARLASDAAARATPPVPAVQSAWPALTLSGLVQIDAAVRQSSSDEVRQSGDLLNQDRFLLRRGRMRVTAAYDQLSGLAELDINTVSGSQVRVSAAEVAYQVGPALGAAVGLVKIPFGFEVGQSDKDRLFLERSTVVRALFPGEYDVGARLAGSWRFVRYAVAAQNGEPAGERGFALRDPNQDKDITARVGIATPVGSGLSVAAGVSVLTGRGFHAGTPATKDVLVWKDLNEDGVVSANEVQVVPGLSATPSANFDRFGVGADAQLSLELGGLGKLTAYGELIVAGNLDRAIVIADPTITAAGRDFRELGYYAGLIYEPTARFALGARFDRYDPDSDASELRVGSVIPLDQTFSTLSVAGALRGSHGRLILEYDHNINHSGRTTAGDPTNLGDDAVTLRAEIQL